MRTALYSWIYLLTYLLNALRYTAVVSYYNSSVILHALVIINKIW